MRSHLKAASAGLISGPRRLLITAIMCALLLVTLLPGAAAAAPGTKGVVSWFGTTATGTLGGEFNTPRGVAVSNSSGDVYVVDTGNNRVQQLSAVGSFIRAWGFDVIQPTKSGDLGSNVFEVCTVAADCKAGINTISPSPGGQFNAPQGIAIDQADGSVYVTDQGFLRVQKFSSSGAFQLAFGKDVDTAGGTATEVCVTAASCKTGVSGALGGEFGSSFAGHLAVAPTGSPAPGNVIVADPANRRVQEFSSAGAFVRTFGFDVAGAGGGADNTGTGFEVCTQAVAGAANCKVAAATGAGVGQFATNQPTRVAVDTTGAIYTVESATNNRVQKFTPQVGPPPLSPAVFAAPQLSGTPAPTDVAVDPSNNHVYVTKPVASPADRQVRELTSTGVLQFTHGAGSGLTSANGLAVKAADGPLYQSSVTAGHRVYVLDNLTPASAEMDPLTPVDAITSDSAMLHAKVNPNGPPNVSYRFEYSLDGVSWTPVSTPDILLGSQLTAQSVSELLKPGVGLEPNTLYHVRVVATRPFNPNVTSAGVTFTTSAQKPIAETTGSPVRTATTLRLDSRVTPLNTATTYHFEYGTQGPCASNPCTATADQPAGSGGLTRLVSQQVAGLSPGTTYHYRVVADNGAPGPPSFGEGRTVTTRASDGPLSHGHFPGPPGSDRAWEQVNTPDTSGNPIFGGLAFSDDGNRAIYQVLGGLSEGSTGSFKGLYFAERTPAGWKTTDIFPKRGELPGPDWLPPAGRSDLSSLISLNSSPTTGDKITFRVGPNVAPVNVFDGAFGSEYKELTLVSDDASRIVELLEGEFDPAYPAASTPAQLYDVATGTPHLASLLPGDVVASCGIGGPGLLFSMPADFFNIPRRATHWLSADGSLLFFSSQGNSCAGEAQLYMRDLEAETTTSISGTPVSGPACSAALIKSTPDAAFFWTQSRLAPEDTEVAGCKSAIEQTASALGGDVYRYDLGSEALDCVTCLAPRAADVYPGASAYGPGVEIAVAENGARVYFTTKSHLLPGAPPDGIRAIYRVAVATGDFDYVGPLGGSQIGDSTTKNEAITPDGAVFVFMSKDSALNPLTGSDNGGTQQYYRYDDRDRTLVCASCPQDGSAPVAEVKGNSSGELVSLSAAGSNVTPLDANGTFFFNTPTPLVNADQNTAGSGQDPDAGTDVYEWRDGRLLLVTDGLTNWPSGQRPDVAGVDPSGTNVFFGAAAQYTADALDGIRRLYTARLGGGIDFPVPPNPCPLEVCQGTPKGAPEEAAAGSTTFSGPVNPTPHFKHKKKHHKKKHKKHQQKKKGKPKKGKQDKSQQRAGHDGRTAR